MPIEPILEHDQFVNLNHVIGKYAIPHACELIAPLRHAFLRNIPPWSLVVLKLCLSRSIFCRDFSCLCGGPFILLDGLLSFLFGQHGRSRRFFFSPYLAPFDFAIDFQLKHLIVNQ